VLARLHAWATAAWLGLAGGAGLGFVARDLLGLAQPEVAFSWFAGATLGLAWAARGLRERLRGTGGGSSEDGQATIEWTALVLFASLALAALLSIGPRIDGLSFGGFLAHRITCAIEGGCRDGDRALARAYGKAGAALVRAHAPNLVYEPGERQLPVDWRRCRRSQCAMTRDSPDLDVHRSDAGEPATVFTRVLHRGGRAYLQYWLYYPDSKSTVLASDKLWEAAWLIPRLRGLVARTPRYPGYHRDDWESYVIRLDPGGGAWARASSHGHWQGCREKDCRGDWAARTGWTRVSRGSHAGHIPLGTELRGDPRRGAVERRQTPLLPGLDLHERTTTGEGLRLIPLETLGRRRYRPNAKGIRPPWRKDAYRDPESEGS
jgi:hypothetical protein